MGHRYILEGRTSAKKEEVLSYEMRFIFLLIHNHRKEEGVSTNPTFNVSVIFGKRDEASLLLEQIFFLGLCVSS